MPLEKIFVIAKQKWKELTHEKKLHYVKKYNHVKKLMEAKAAAALANSNGM
jgi:hypothetical protein